MQIVRNNGASARLDRLRMRQGENAVKAAFSQTAQADAAKAAQWLNDENLRFATFYILLPGIASQRLTDALSPRGRAACALCARFLNGPSAGPEEEPPEQEENADTALRWMFRTGAEDDGMNDEFDRILDLSASLLIQTYGAADVLPAAVRLLFRRNRKQRYIHDLAWALFRSRDPSVLRLIAVYLRSSNSRDVELARRLLRFSPFSLMEEEEQTGRPLQYASYAAWYAQNRPYLYFTGEGFHKTSDPSPCRVDLGAKYLGKPISPVDRRMLKPLTQEEHSRLAYFAGMEEEDKRLLAEYSRRLRMKDRRAWDRWMVHPPGEQLQAARTRTGARYD